MDGNTMDLVLDEGNTRTKMALCSGSLRSSSGIMENGDRSALRAFIGGRDLSGIVMGSVARQDASYHSHLERYAPLLLVQGDTPTPLGSRYCTPRTLGADRLANMVGAFVKYPGRPVLVIDPGTCITYDVLEADGTHAGGVISPGMRMRSRSMNAYSASLPAVDPEDTPPLLGESTQTALTAGIHHGITGEMIHFVERFGQERPGMAVVLTGGDTMRFSRALKSGIFAHPLLTLDGLHEILRHHRTLHGIAPDGGSRGGDRPGAAG